MSTVSAPRANGARRVAIFSVLLIVATAVIFALTAANLPSRASAADLATQHGVTTLGAVADRAASNVQRDVESTSGPTVAHRVAAASISSAAGRKTADERAASVRTVNVWADGFQADINDCRGGVDVTAHYGVRTIAEHWTCGGSRFPTAKGSIVTFTGKDAGTYRVIGVVAVLNVATAHTSDLPHGYNLLYQTCRNNDSATMEFVALSKL